MMRIAILTVSLLFLVACATPEPAQLDPSLSIGESIRVKRSWGASAGLFSPPPVLEIIGSPEDVLALTSMFISFGIWIDVPEDGVEHTKMQGWVGLLELPWSIALHDHTPWPLKVRLLGKLRDGTTVIIKEKMVAGP